MICADIIYNAGMVVFDVLFVYTVIAVWRRKRSRVTAIFLILALWSIPVILASFVQRLFSFRIFATMRFIGLAAFWHLPLILIVLAVYFRNNKMLRRLFLLGAIIPLGLYVYAYHMEPYRLEITRYDYQHPGLKGLERSVVIAQVSDLQTEHMGSFEYSVLQTLGALKPDLIIYTGDYFHTWNQEKQDREIPLLRQAFQAANLAPPLGSYAVCGDCESRADVERLFEKTSTRILNNESVTVDLPGCKVTITGLTCSSSRAARWGELAGAFQDNREGLFNIVIGHSPDFVEALASKNIPFLALAGHTHGGQVQLPLLGPLFTLSRLPKNYADCFAPFGTGTLSVSRGIGMERREAPRLRFLCRPEIRLITLHPSD